MKQEFSLWLKPFECSLFSIHSQQNAQSFGIEDTDWVDLTAVMKPSTTWWCWEAPKAGGMKYSALVCLKMEKDGLRTRCVGAENMKGHFRLDHPYLSMYM